MAKCFLEAVEAIPSISIIDHKFLESGHTHIECGSMHSAVEHAKKNIPICTSYKWDTVLRQARKKTLYCCTCQAWIHEGLLKGQERQAEKREGNN